MTTASSTVNASAAVLIIIDSDTEANTLKTILEANYHNATVAKSPAEAKVDLETREFAVIVCQLSGMGAMQIDAAKSLRTHRANANTPIILMTPSGMNQGLAMRAVGTGVIDCVEYPADDFVLRAKVKMYADIYRSAKRLREMETKATPASNPFIDALTGLPTRTLFLDRAEQAMRQASRSGGRVALAVMDLDQIQDVRETLGPVSSEELVRQIALRFSGALRRSDTVGRIGEMSFASVLACDTRDGVETVTSRLERVMSEAYVVGGHRISLGNGIGVALFPEHGREAADLLECATAVMAIAKQNSLGHLFYDPITHHRDNDDSADTSAEMNAEELFRVHVA